MTDHVLNRQQLEAAIVQLDPLEEMFARRVLMTDRFSGYWCVRCGYYGAMFTVLGVPLGLCPRCVAKRIDLLREDDFPVPDRRSVRTRTSDGLGFWESLAWLELSALAQVREQDRQAADRLQIRLDPPLRCRRCRAKVVMESARCLPSPAGNALAWCEPCWASIVDPDHDVPAAGLS